MKTNDEKNSPNNKNTTNGTNTPDNKNTTNETNTPNNLNTPNETTTPNALENKRTYYQLILDRSGSMSSCMEETVTGVNSQIRRIKELAERYPEQEIATSLCLFNHNVSQVRDRVSAAMLEEISYSDYHPTGNTALYDAIGLSIRRLQQTIGPEVERNEASVVVVIFTDGHENASSQFSHRTISSLIRELELTDNWSFSYIGATIDAVDIAVHLNIRASNAAQYSVKNSVQEFNKVADRMAGYVFLKGEGITSKDFLKNDDSDR